MYSRTTACALGGLLLAAPATAAAAEFHDPPAPRREALRAPLAGHPSVKSQMRSLRRELDRERLLARHGRLARRHARLVGERVTDSDRARVRDAGPAELRRRNRELRGDIRRELRERRRARAAAAAARAVTTPTSGGATSGGAVGAPGHLAAIAACESGGNPSAVGGGGRYRGLYQFDQSTWQSVGGTGDPAAASPAEQTQRAAILYSRTGGSAWPVCGR